MLCKHTTSGGNHQPHSWNNHSRAEHVTNLHSPFPLYCQTYRPGGTMVVLSPPADFGLEAMCQPQDGRKERSCHTTYCLLFLGCSPVLKQWGTFWMFLTSAKIHRSVVQLWCCVVHIMWSMQAFVHMADSIESPG